MKVMENTDGLENADVMHPVMILTVHSQEAFKSTAIRYLSDSL